MDVADHPGLRQGEKVAVVFEVLGRVFESLPADIRLGHAIGAYGGAHRSIDDGDAVVENVLKGMPMNWFHIFLIAV
jgi:hypothetical protein